MSIFHFPICSISPFSKFLFVAIFPFSDVCIFRRLGFSSFLAGLLLQKTAKNIECNAYGVMSGGYDLESLIKAETNLNYKIFPNLIDTVKHLIKNNYI